MLTSIISAIIILGTLVLIHEAGHFVVAKRCGVRVLRFSIGYPPKLFGIRRGETEYAIGATPFGGYVRMLGDEIGDELGPAEVQVYLTEVARDLVQAAENAAPVDPELRSVVEARNDESLMLAQAAGQSGPAQDNAKSSADRELNVQLYALTQALGRSPDPERLMRKMLGRAPRQEERDLLDEVQRRKEAAEAIKFLSEHRTPALMRQIEKRSFPTQSLPKRFAIVLAGPAANILLAPILLAFVFMYGVPSLLPVVGQLQKGMPAAKAGLHQGDRILSIDAQPIHTWEDLSAAVKKSHGAQLKIEIERADSQRQSLAMVPTQVHEPGAMGE